MNCELISDFGFRISEYGLRNTEYGIRNTRSTNTNTPAHDNTLAMVRRGVLVKVRWRVWAPEGRTAVMNPLGWLAVIGRG